jgi:NodT family efflux transporter outer membrane factor (OMF) lipoprotein
MNEAVSIPLSAIRFVHGLALGASRPIRRITPAVLGRSGRWVGALAVATLVLGGCTTVGPDFQTPEATVAPEWIEASDAKVKTEPPSYADWWQVFNDPVLNQLIDTARQQNLDLRNAGLRILEARAQLGIAVGQMYPQTQQASGSASANQLSKNAPNSAGADGFFYNFGVGFDAAWELDVWGRFRRSVESAEANLTASVANYDDALVSLLAEVARNYALVRTFEERIRIAEENVKIQQGSLRIAQVRFENGAVTELDVTQATTLLRTTEAQVPFLTIGLRQSENALAVLLGTTPNQVREILGAPGNIPVTPTEVAVGIPADLLRRRPDVRRAELQAAGQSALIGLAEADLYPSFSLFGSIGVQSSAKGGARANNAGFGDLFSSDSLTYSFGPSFVWPILNYGRIKNNVRVQDARLQELIVSYQNTVLRAAAEVENALVGFLRSQDQARLLGESVDAAKRSVDLSLIQYRDGAVDYNRVLDSQRSLATQQDTYTQARGDISTNLVALYKALGGGWEVRLGEDFVPEATKEQMRQRTNWGKLLGEPAPESLSPPPPAREQKLFPTPEW